MIVAFNSPELSSKGMGIVMVVRAFASHLPATVKLAVLMLLLASGSPASGQVQAPINTMAPCAAPTRDLVRALATSEVDRCKSMEASRRIRGLSAKCQDYLALKKEYDTKRPQGQVCNELAQRYQKAYQEYTSALYGN